jgi:NAD(P)-dependent dehydrogenase (short-subunit alcohol dehydrogenase family)
MQTVFITGIDKGIGRALMEQFLREGFFVVGTYLIEPPEEIHEHFEAIPLDLSKPESIAVCVQTFAAQNKKIDILINNAGVMLDESETHVVVEKLRNTLEVNLIGTIDLTEQILPHVVSGGHIVNISSTAGSLEDTDHNISHFPGHYPAYKISKAALNMYTRTLAMRLKKENITVSSVHPGWVQTDMGGQEAAITPKEAAEGIFATAIARPETGQFWYNNTHVPW